MSNGQRSSYNKRLSKHADHGVIRGMHRDVRPYAKLALAQGWNIRQLQNSHYRWYPPIGDFIQTSKTPRGSCFIHSIVCDLKRAGLKIAEEHRQRERKTDTTEEPIMSINVNAAPAELGPIGEALLKASEEAKRKEEEKIVKAPPLSAHPPRYTTQQVLQAHFENFPNTTLSVDVLLFSAKIKIPQISGASVYKALQIMVAAGHIRRVGRGEYRLVSSLEEVARKFNQDIDAMKKKPTLPGAVSGSATGDPSLDADLKTLDEALVALSHIEDVVKRTREKIAAVAQLKQLLNT